MSSETVRTEEFARRDDVRHVLFFAGICGLFLGLATGWQIAIESAQVVAGIVEYPRDNPFALYHLKSWTLLHQIPALLLAGGCSEQDVSLGIAALVGMVSFQALALCTLACGGSRWLSAASPLVCLGTKVYAESSSIYPIRILSDSPWVLYGCVGTALALLAWTLMANGWARTAAFLMGVSPAVHPTMGAWCLGIGALSAMWTWRQDGDSLRALSKRFAAPWLAAGLSVCIVSLACHWLSIRGLPTAPDVVKERYLAAFAAGWDSHRVSFPMEHMVVVMAGLCMALCGVWLAAFRQQLAPAATILLRTIFLSATCGIVLCAATHWQSYLPSVVLMAMPGRYVNVAGLAFPAILLGLMHRWRTGVLAHGIFAGLAFYSFVAVQRFELGRLYVPGPGVLFVACGMAALILCRELFDDETWLAPQLRWLRLVRMGACLGIFELACEATRTYSTLGIVLWAMFAALLVPRRWRFWSDWRWPVPVLNAVVAASLLGIAWLQLGFAFTACLTAAMLAAALLRRAACAEFPARLFNRAKWSFGMSLAAGSAACALLLFHRQRDEALTNMPDWRNNAVYAAASRGHGFILAGSTVRATQLRTRRPVLLEGAALNQLPYVPESGPEMNRILQRVYGEDLFRPRHMGWSPGGGLHHESGRELWEARRPEEWQSLAKEFGFTEIVTFSKWRLKLPVVARSKNLLLYRVPAEERVSQAGDRAERIRLSSASNR